MPYCFCDTAEWSSKGHTRAGKLGRVLKELSVVLPWHTFGEHCAHSNQGLHDNGRPCHLGAERSGAADRNPESVTHCRSAQWICTVIVYSLSSTSSLICLWKIWTKVKQIQSRLFALQPIQTMFALLLFEEAAICLSFNRRYILFSQIFTVAMNNCSVSSAFVSIHTLLFRQCLPSLFRPTDKVSNGFTTDNP